MNKRISPNVKSFIWFRINAKSRLGLGCYMKRKNHSVKYKTQSDFQILTYIYDGDFDKIKRKYKYFFTKEKRVT